MPMIDMPLEKLKVYQGINPRPDDFDEYWDKALEEMRAIDPCPTFKPYDLPSKIADAYELTFTSTKGAKIYAKFLKPKQIDGKAPALLRFHGLGGSSPEWTTLLPYASQGYVVAAMDARGQGGYSQDVGGAIGTTLSNPFLRGIDGPPEGLQCRDQFLDTAMLARVVMGLDYVDEARVGATGESQGGALTLACASLVPEIKACAPVYPYLCDYKRVWEMDLDKGAYDAIRYYLRNFDPTHEHVDEFFLKLGYIDLQYLAPRIKAKVLMHTGLMDVTCPPSTQFAAYNKITSPKQMLIYPDFGHEGLKTGDTRTFKFFANEL